MAAPEIDSVTNSNNFHFALGRQETFEVHGNYFTKDNLAALIEEDALASIHWKGHKAKWISVTKVEVKATPHSNNGHATQKDFFASGDITVTITNDEGTGVTPAPIPATY